MNVPLFQLQEWTPELVVTAQEVATSIRETLPELKVFFTGAAALKLPGRNNVDLDILCPSEDVSLYTRLLTPLLGKPKHLSATGASWNVSKHGFQVYCVLSDSKIASANKRLKVFEALNTNLALRKQYEKLKRASNGLPASEYEKRKKLFLDRLA